MKKIEIILAYEDRTWDTEILEVPKELQTSDETSLREWIEKKVHLDGVLKYREVVFAGVYNLDPFQGEWEDHD